MLDRLASSLNYRLKWARLGIYYVHQPALNSIRLGHKRASLSFPATERETHEYEFGRILLDDCYRLSTNSRSLHTIVDVGANIGLFALAARRRFPHATIHCYEPNPALLPHLASHCASAGAQMHASAVGKEKGTVNLKFGVNSLHTVTTASDNGDVPMESFCSVIENAGEVDLLKLDCEGAEWDIFECPRVWPKIRSLAMEYHLWAKPASSLAFLRSELGRLGFPRVEIVPSENGPWGFAWAHRAP